MKNTMQPKKKSDLLDPSKLHELLTSIRNHGNNPAVKVEALRNIAVLTFQLDNTRQVFLVPDLISVLVDSISPEQTARIKLFALTSLAHLAEDKNNGRNMLFVLGLLDRVLAIAMNLDEPQNVRDEAIQILSHLRACFVDHSDFHDGDEFYDVDEVMRFWRLICAMWIVRSAQVVPRVGKHSSLRRFPQEMSRLLFHALNDLMADGGSDGAADGDGEQAQSGSDAWGSDGSEESLADFGGIPARDHLPNHSG